MCNRIIGHKMFDHIVLAIIFLNCITIAMERPRIEPASAVSQRLPPHSHTLTHTHSNAASITQLVMLGSVSLFRRSYAKLKISGPIPVVNNQSVVVYLLPGNFYLSSLYLCV